MKTNTSLDKRSAEVDHKRKMDNLRTRHQNEREKIDNQHNHNMNQIKNQNRVEIDEARIEHKKKFVEQSQRQEQTLSKVKDSLEAVKERTTKEMHELRAMQAQKKIDEEKLFKADYQNKKVKHQIVLEDIDHEANTNLKKIKEQIKNEEKELTQTGREESKNLRDSHLTKMGMKKEEFAQKKMHEENKFSTNLRHQKKNHTDQLTKQERTHQSNIDKRARLFKQNTDIIERNGKASNAQMQKRYEGTFNENFTKNEKRLQALSHHKEKILNDLKGMFKREVKLSLDKDTDPFYQNVSLSPEISENEKKDGYILRVEVPKHDADKVKLTGSGRQLKLAMDRDYTFEKKSDDGLVNKVSKSETMIQKIPVEKIIDSKSIERSYQDGELVFKIGLT